MNKEHFDREYHEINDSVVLNFEIPEVLRNLMNDAEEADMANDWGTYLNLADAIDVWAKNYYADGQLSSKQWNLICRRYPQ